MMSRVSTRVRFVLAMMLLLVPVIAIAAIILDESFKRSQEQIITSEFATADVVSQSVSELIRGQQQVLGVLAETEAIRSLDKQKDQASAQMDEYRLSRQSVNGLFLLKNDLTVVAQTGGIEISSLTGSGFKAAAEAAVQGGQPTVSDVILLPSGEVKVIAIVVPVFANADASASEAPSGALGAFYSVERLIAGFQPPAGFSTGSNIAVALVSSAGSIVSVPGGTSDPSQIFQDGPQLETAIKSALANQRTRATFKDPSGLSRVTVAVPIDMPGNDWAVLVSAPETTSYGPNRMLIERAVIAAIGVVVLSFLLAILLAEWLARPFRLLTSQAKALSTGAVVLDLEPVGPTDAATLSRTIREMADRLRAQIRDTEAAREEIARQAETLRDLLRRTVRLQEDERRRIASDIHDAVSPLITGALYQAQAVRMARSGSNGNGHEGNGHHADQLAAAKDDDSLQEVSELLERAMRELHDVIFDLRPPDLDDIGLEAAIQRHVDQVNRSGLPCTLEVIGEERRLSPEVRLAIYRIVQEALHNSIRHARADESFVRIEWLPERLRVTVQDDGSGFINESTERRAGLGLMSMRERAGSIGASLDIVSRPGTGTAIVVERMNDGLDLTADTPAAEPQFDDQPEPGDSVEEDTADAGEEHALL
ncbi:MAG TPA: ATP-binding protein [Thermomicrobiales bacterium]|nr:ATP-binding protein [Thermomicrobiales bacterium]